jgi:hypothetical protein
MPNFSWFYRVQSDIPRLAAVPSNLLELQRSSAENAVPNLFLLLYVQDLRFVSGLEAQESFDPMAVTELSP